MPSQSFLENKPQPTQTVDTDIGDNYSNLRNAAFNAYPERLFGLEDTENLPGKEETRQQFKATLSGLLNSFHDEKHLHELADLGKGLAKGAFAGVLGLPGDIEGMGRGGIAVLKNTKRGGPSVGESFAEGEGIYTLFPKSSEVLNHLLPQNASYEEKAGSDLGVIYGQVAIPELNAAHKGLGALVTKQLEPAKNFISDIQWLQTVGNITKGDPVNQTVFNMTAKQILGVAKGAVKGGEEGVQTALDETGVKMPDIEGVRKPTSGILQNINTPEDAVAAIRKNPELINDPEFKSFLQSKKDVPGMAAVEEGVVKQSDIVDKLSGIKNQNDLFKILHDEPELAGEPMVQDFVSKLTKELGKPEAGAGEEAAAEGESLPGSAAVPPKKRGLGDFGIKPAEVPAEIEFRMAPGPVPSVIEESDALKFLQQESGKKMGIDPDAYMRGEQINPVKINLDRVNGTSDVKDAIVRVSKMLKGSEVQTHEATLALADAVGLTPDKLLAGYRGANLNAQEAVATRMILDSSAAQLVEQAQKAGAETATAEDIHDFIQMFAKHRGIQAYAENARAEAGRTLNAWGIMGKNPQDRANIIKNIIASIGGNPDIQMMARQIADLDRNPLKVSRFTAAVFGSPGRDLTMKVWYNVLLSNPTTVVKKLTTDMFQAGWNVLTTGAAEVGGHARAALGGAEAGVPWGETGQLLYGYQSSFVDAVRTAGQALKSGQSQFMRDYGTLDAYGVMGPGNPLSKVVKAESEKPLDINQPTSAMRSLFRSIMPTSWIGAADDFAKYWNYRAELRRLAYREVSGMPLDQMPGSPSSDTMMSMLMDNVPADMHKQAVQTALRNTFQEPLQGVGKAIQQGIDKLNIPIVGTSYKLPVGRMIMPFVKVPLNLAKWSYTNSAVAAIMPTDAFRAEMAAGGATRDLAIAKMTAGTTLGATMLPFVLGGHITGRGPGTPEANAAWRRAGNAPYTLKWGGKAYDYGGLEPLSFMMGTIADSYSILHFATDRDAEEVVASLGFGMGHAMMSRTYMSGLANLFEGFESPDTKGGDWIDRLFSSMVPAGVAAANRVMTDWQKSHYGFMDGIESRLPWVSGKLPPARTIWGDPVPLKDVFTPLGTMPDPGLPITRAARMFSPVGVTDVGHTEPIDKWVWDHINDFRHSDMGLTGLRMPGLWQTFSMGSEVSTQAELTPIQHDRLAVLAGNELKDPQYGLGCKDALNALVTGKFPDPTTQRQFDSASPAYQTELIQHKFMEYREAAKHELLLEFPTLNKAVQIGWQNRMQKLQQPGTPQ